MQLCMTGRQHDQQKVSYEEFIQQASGGVSSIKVEGLQNARMSGEHLCIKMLLCGFDGLLNMLQD